MLPMRLLLTILLAGLLCACATDESETKKPKEEQSEAPAPPPRMGTRVDTRFIRGMGKREDQFLILLDLERVLSDEELAVVAASAAAAG